MDPTKLNMKILRVFSLLLVLLLASSACAAEKPDNHTLKGIVGVRIVIEPLNSDAVKAGLKTDDLISDVEARLRAAGIKILSDKEAERSKFSGDLSIKVGLDRSKDAPLLCFSVQLHLKQGVMVLRSSEIYACTTWEKSAVGTVKPENIIQIREIVKNMVDGFAREYWKQNKK